MDAKHAYEVALQIILVELLKAVALEIKRTPKFRTLLRRLHRTLTTIEPILYGNRRLARVLDRPEKETKLFISYLENGKETVLKCSMVKCWNVYKKFVHANKLIRLDNELLKFFQVELQHDLITSLVSLALGDEPDRALSVVDKRAGGFSSSSNVAGLSDVIIGFDLHLQELKRMLIKEEKEVLIVSAPGGCGKTTLVKMLCHDKEIKGIYGDNIFYVTISKTTSLKTVVQKLFAHHLHVDNCEIQTDEEAKSKLESKLRKMGSQKILLVLDDVWSESESLICDLNFSIPGYTILVTSRFMFTGIGSTYKLSLLNDEDATTLLCHLAFSNDGNQIKVSEDLMIKMVKCCKGLPLALTVIGASLRNQGELEWRATLQKWDEGKSIFDSNSQLLLSLQASVDALEHLPIVRDCFLDLGSFPEDEKISTSALMDLWVELYNLDKEGMHISEYLLELSSRNLLSLVPISKYAIEIEGYCNENYVTQHDLLRELAIHLSNQEPIPQRKRLLLELHGNGIPAWWIQKTQQPSETRLLSISADATFSSVWNDLKAPKVQALVLNMRSKEYTIPHFIKRFKELKFLKITSYDVYPTKLHEISLISTLSILKRMRLEHVSLSPSLHTIFELNNLQKLSIIMCEIGSALKNCTLDTSILPNLLELEFESCYDLKEVPEALCSLDHLEKLSITNCHELETLPKEFGSQTNLETLQLHSCTRLAELPGSIGNLKRLKLLDISDCLSIKSLPDDIGELHGLRVLKMSGCHGLEELPASVSKLTLLEDVICDEETSYLWSYYESELRDLKINVVEEDKFANFMKIVG